MGRWITGVAALSLVGACSRPSADKNDTGDAGVPSGDTCTPGTPPEIDGISIEEGEPTADGPALLVALSASDADADLHSYQIDLWFDTETDGFVEQGTDNHIAPGPVTLDVIDCGAPAIASEIEIVLLGEDVLAFDTNYEFAAVITDASGLESAPAVTTAQTPGGR